MEVKRYSEDPNKYWPLIEKFRLKTFDEPLIEVIELESNPPVQDSAKDILSFFLTNSLTTFFDNLFI